MKYEGGRYAQTKNKVAEFIMGEIFLGVKELVVQL